MKVTIQIDGSDVLINASNLAGGETGAGRSALQEVLARAAETGAMNAGAAPPGPASGHLGAAPQLAQEPPGVPFITVDGIVDVAAGPAPSLPGVRTIVAEDDAMDSGGPNA